MALGKVETLWRYPVKSLIGESLGDLVIDSRGVSGDRLYAISNSDGKFGSGKDTRRFRRIDGLFSMSAETTENGISIRFPDGSVFLGSDPAIDNMLSQTLGQSVTLTKEGDISHFDDGAVHILTTESLSLLNQKLPGSGIDPKRFRPNLVIASRLQDQELLGKVINIGSASLEVTHKTERCRMITIEQPGFENRPDILKVVSQGFGLDFGVYAKVISTGSVSVGDKVEFIQK
ncbi:MAG: MOSC domain-containing protein [Arenicella sp.]